MALYTTGVILNTPVLGVRPSATLTVLLTNDGSTSIDVQISGFNVSGTTKVQYVAELFAIAPGEVAIRSYLAQFNALEFQFNLSSVGMEISVWGKDAAGNISFAHRAVPEEVNQVG